MLTLTEIAALVEPWYVEGRIRQSDFETLKAQYLSEIGASPGQCTTCSSFRRDVLHHFRYQLRQNNFPIMETTRKYMLADEVNQLQLPGDNRLIVNEAGDDEENRRPLTNELAEQLLASDEAYKQFIVRNPAYKEPAPKAAAPAKPATDAAKTGTAATKPATKPSAPAKPKPAPASKAAEAPAGTQLGLDTTQPDVAKAQKADEAAQKSTGAPLSEAPDQNQTNA
ncbi:hypothetical protein A6C57_01180 [Fibrella sp. ES10-3-2-2]|nr:hypothetical protein A6C57_01180 [Fibrella sp. ES10-3-2-2]